MFGRVWDGFLEIVALELSHSLWIGLGQRQKGRESWKDILGGGNIGN